jgi:hypothetical protein
MAKPKRTTRITFYEVVMAGSHKMVRGFITGLQLGRQEEKRIYYHFQEGVFHEKFPERLAEAVHILPEDCHLIVDSKIRDLLKRFARPMEAELGLRIKSIRYIRSAVLPFRFEAYARRYGVEIMGILNGLPPGVRLQDFKHKEKVYPRAAGLEAYAATHEYEIKGSGKVVGRVDLVIQARRNLDSHPLIKPAQIKLNLA